MEITLGVRHGDTLSPTLFSLYVNDLVTLLNELNLGISLNDIQVTALFYADDLVLVAPNESALQEQLIAFNSWCRKWRLSVNENKTKNFAF